MQYDLNAASVDTSKANRAVVLTPTIGMTFRWPTIKDYMEAFSAKDSTTKYIYMIVESLYDENQVYTKNDFTEEEFSKWIEELTDDQILKVKEFMDNIPELRQELNYKCPKCDHQHSKLLEGLHDFFRLDDDQ